MNAQSAALVFLLWGLSQAAACGPDFPNWLLDKGDAAVLVAPFGNFAAELVRMDLVRTRLLAVPAVGEDERSQSINAEIGDLEKSLKLSKTPRKEVDRICREHRVQREKLVDFIQTLQTWTYTHRSGRVEDNAPSPPMPLLTNVVVTEGLPGEFMDYFEGFLAWHDPEVVDKQKARTSWLKLLSRPQVERKYKSTWAAFMLGKSWEQTDPEKAVEYFHRVRDLALAGYRDSLGLAAASIGLEARICLRQTNYERGIELYLDQMATGDRTATNSLAFAADQALQSGTASLLRLARNQRTQKVITAYVISRHRDDSIYTPPPSAEGEQEAVVIAADSWLDAVEQAGIRDLDSAEALALAAYHANDIEKTRRWIQRAPTSPLSQWLQAKLLLRAGKLKEAATLLARVTEQFPIVHEGTNAPPRTERKDHVSVAGIFESRNYISAERQVHGELGVLRLARGQYVEALDSLLNAGFWMDAAYVAERVLNLEELRSYVDRFWPPASADQVAQEVERFGESDVCPARLRESIRYLLARRITRELRNEEARQYYPEAWTEPFDRLMSHLRAGWAVGEQPQDRASDLLQAALLTRTNGMELLGTEVSPDWHYHDGQYTEGVTSSIRESNSVGSVTRPSEDELRRSAEHHPEPDQRFHYRYLAASLAWETAKLLPDNTDLTAYALWQGGTFLKLTDPQVADYFYKALVNRNRKTILGFEADRQRWFPVIDANGNIVHKKRKQAAPTTEQRAPESETTPGQDGLPRETAAAAEPSQEAKPFEYVVHRGDSLALILRACEYAGQNVTLEELLQANPQVDPNKLKIGQIILVPVKAP
jgi:hypothetical protein